LISGGSFVFLIKQALFFCHVYVALDAGFVAATIVLVSGLCGPCGVERVAAENFSTTTSSIVVPK